MKQRIEDSNKPRIEVRGIKQAIWKDAMSASDEVRIKYASKYAGSSNYWKNSIGMNRGLANLNVIERKKEEEAAFAAWAGQTPERKAKYGEVLNLLEKGILRRMNSGIFPLICQRHSSAVLKLCVWHVWYRVWILTVLLRKK